MRRLVRRSELVPESRALRDSTPEATPRLTEDDREFLDLLKRHHSKQKYKYMKQWWEKKDPPYPDSR